MPWASRATFLASMLVLCAHGCQWITGASERDLTPAKPGGDASIDSGSDSGSEAGRDSGSDADRDSGSDSGTETDSGARCDGRIELDPVGDCKQLVCSADARIISKAKTDDIPIDENPCTQDLCTGSVPSNPNQVAGTPCGDGGFCSGAGTCITQCNNKTLDPDEIDVDCGGATCPQCDDGKKCKAEGDCQSGMCSVCTNPLECDFCPVNCEEAFCGPPPHSVEGACAVILWRDRVIESQSTPALCDTAARNVQLRVGDIAYAYVKRPPNNELMVTATSPTYLPGAWSARCVVDFGTRDELVAAALESSPDWTPGVIQPGARVIDMSISCPTAALYMWMINLPALE